jgi:outer membrane murein-binding lipoprotein Lpp
MIKSTKRYIMVIVALFLIGSLLVGCSADNGGDSTDLNTLKTQVEGIGNIEKAPENLNMKKGLKLL